MPINLNDPVLRKQLEEDLRRQFGMSPFAKSQALEPVDVDTPKVYETIARKTRFGFPMVFTTVRHAPVTGRIPPFVEQQRSIPVPKGVLRSITNQGHSPSTYIIRFGSTGDHQLRIAITGGQTFKLTRDIAAPFIVTGSQPACITTGFEGSSDMQQHLLR